MNYIVGRPINGISLNGLEYLLNEKGEKMLFNSKENAKSFLERRNGISNEEIETFIIKKEEDF